MENGYTVSHNLKDDCLGGEWKCKYAYLDNYHSTNHILITYRPDISLQHFDENLVAIFTIKPKN